MAENYEVIKGFQTKQGLGRYDYDYLHNKPDLATQEQAGLLSPEDKVKIDQIDEIKQAVDEIDYPVDSVNGKIGQVELTKDDIGLDKVENKSSEEIRNEITKENVTGALGYTPLTEDEVNEAVQGANSAAQAAQITADKALQGVATAQNAITETREIAEDARERIDDLGPQTVQGEIITLSDSGEAPLWNLKLYGKTMQNGTPTPEAPIPLESVGDDGSVAVTVCGKNLISPDEITLKPGARTNLFVYKTNGLELPKGTYTISLPEVAPGSYVYEHGNPVAMKSVWNKTSLTFTLDKSMRVWFDFFKSEGFADGTENKIQLEVGSAVTDYEPYKAQTLTAQTPNGLPGIPVSSGGNYTDENGQQWICDEIDFASGKYVKRIGVKILNGTETYTQISSNPNCWRIVVPEMWTEGAGFRDDFSSFLVLSCSHFKSVLYKGASQAEDGTVTFYSTGEHIIRFTLHSKAVPDYMAEQYAGGNPVKVLYMLGKPIETDLTAEEIAQYSALHTNYPNTTVYNDEGAGMSITYSSPNTALPISGGRMAGPIDMNNNSLTGLAQPQKDSDAATKTYVDELVKNIDLSNYPTKEEVNTQFEEFQVDVDPTLSQAGQAADAQAVGQAINQIEEQISGFSGFVAQNEPPEDIEALWIDTDDEAAEQNELDDSLTIKGMAADAKAVGDAIADVVYADENDEYGATVPLNADTLGGRPASEFATKTFVQTKIAEAQLDGGEVDLSGYATKDDLNTLTAEGVGARPDTWLPTIAEIGAAPAGYGLGEDAPSITLTDCNDATKSGWYRTADGTANQPLARANWMRVDAYSSMYLCQTWFNDQYDGCTATRFKIGDNKWTPWEWVNPPMALGVEYRTTERWNANPVYTMMANIGALPNNTGKTTEGGPLPMGITPISAYGIGLNGKTGAVIPSRHIYLSVYGEWGTVYVNTDSDYSNYTGYIIVKYVKIKEGRQ